MVTYIDFHHSLKLLMVAILFLIPTVATTRGDERGGSDRATTFHK